MQKLTFKQWMKQVDKILADRLEGLDSSCLRDRCYRDAYDDELEPLEFVDDEFGTEFESIMMDDLFG